MTTLQLTKTRTTPDQIPRLDAALTPLLTSMVEDVNATLPADRRAILDDLTPDEQATIVTLAVITRLLERAEQVGGPTYQHLLDELGGEVWARSLEVVAGVVESQMAKRAGREQ